MNCFRLLMMLAAMGCGACAADDAPEHPPIATSCVVLWSTGVEVEFACNGRPDPDGLAFALQCDFSGASGDAERPEAWKCIQTEFAVQVTK